MYYTCWLVAYLPLDIDIKNIIKMYLRIKIFKIPSWKKLLQFKDTNEYIDDDLIYYTNMPYQEVKRVDRCVFRVLNGCIHGISYNYQPYYRVNISIDHLKLNCFYLYPKIYNTYIESCFVVISKYLDAGQILKEDGYHTIYGDVTFIYDPSLK